MQAFHTLKIAFGLFLASMTSALMAQNVGIGTATPNTKLHVESNVASDGIRINNTAANGDPIAQFAVNGTNRITMGIDDSDSDKFKIGTTAITTSTRMTIQTNGYIGIGLTTPAHHFSVRNSRANDYVGYFENTSATGAGIAGYAAGTYNALGGVTNNATGLASYGVHLPTNGAGLGVWGISNSSDAVGVEGSVPTTGSWLGYGGLFTGGLGYANGLYNLSDRRMKSEIRPLENALSRIQQVRGVTYKYDSPEYRALLPEDDKTYIGLIAQEIERVFPEATAQKYLIGRPQGPAGPTADMSKVNREIVTVVDYTALVPVLIEAIKEQQAEIEQLKNRLNDLEN
jgi:hypothetical protein